MQVEKTNDYNKFSYNPDRIDQEYLDVLERDGAFDENYLDEEPILIDKNFNILNRVENFIALKNVGKNIPYKIYEDLSDDYILETYKDNYTYQYIKGIVDSVKLPAKLVAFIITNHFDYDPLFESVYYAGELDNDDYLYAANNSKYYSSLLSLCYVLKDKLNLDDEELIKVVFNIFTYSTTIHIDKYLNNMENMDCFTIAEYAVSMIEALLFIDILNMKHFFDLYELKFKNNEIKDNQFIKNLDLLINNDKDQLIDIALDQKNEEFFKLINNYHE